MVVSGSFDATVRLWDTKSQSSKPIQVLEEAGDSVSSVVVRGWDIVTGCVDGRLRVYDLRMGMLSTDLIGCESLLCGGCRWGKAKSVLQILLRRYR